jgi:hypothetical protein
MPGGLERQLVPGKRQLLKHWWLSHWTVRSQGLRNLEYGCPQELALCHGHCFAALLICAWCALRCASCSSVALDHTEMWEGQAARSRTVWPRGKACNFSAHFPWLAADHLFRSQSKPQQALLFHSSPLLCFHIVPWRHGSHLLCCLKSICCSDSAFHPKHNF